MEIKRGDGDFEQRCGNGGGDKRGGEILRNAVEMEIR